MWYVCFILPPSQTHEDARIPWRESGKLVWFVHERLRWVICSISYHELTKYRITAAIYTDNIFNVWVRIGFEWMGGYKAPISIANSFQKSRKVLFSLPTLPCIRFYRLCRLPRKRPWIHLFIVIHIAYTLT